MNKIGYLEILYLHTKSNILEIVLSRIIQRKIETEA